MMAGQSRAADCASRHLRSEEEREHRRPGSASGVEADPHTEVCAIETVAFAQLIHDEASGGVSRLVAAERVDVAAVTVGGLSRRPAVRWRRGTS